MSIKNVTKAVTPHRVLLETLLTTLRAVGEPTSQLNLLHRWLHLLQMDRDAPYAILTNGIPAARRTDHIHQRFLEGLKELVERCEMRIDSSGKYCIQDWPCRLRSLDDDWMV